MISIVLPTYNEAGNIVELVNAIRKNLTTETYEILVVDDDSPDGTFAAVTQEFADEPRVIPILRKTDRGLAKSIRAGVERAQGEVVLIMDTDFTHNPNDIPTMLHLSRAFDVIVGSRFSAGGSMPDVAHYIFSLTYNWLIRVVLRTQIQDNLSGFLTLNRRVIEVLPFDQIFFGYGDYCFRLLHYAQKRGMSILEMPVNYQIRKKGNSKSVFWRLLFSYTRALISLKWAAGRSQQKYLDAARVQEDPRGNA
jgi:dolichol-phosphate mannosyltransferase